MSILIIFGYLFAISMCVITIAVLIIGKMHRTGINPDDQHEYLMRYSRVVQERNAVKQYLQGQKPDAEFYDA